MECLHESGVHHRCQRMLCFRVPSRETACLLKWLYWWGTLVPISLFVAAWKSTFWSTWNIQESMFQKIPGVTCSVPCPRVYLNFGLVVFKYQTEPYGFFSSIFILQWKFWKERPECTLMNGITVGIRAGNFKVMVLNELHSSRSINMYLCVHTICMCV